MSDFSLAIIVFVATYLIIISERLHRTTAALVGGTLMILLGVLSQDVAFAAIDLNVIFLLLGMMMIAHLLGETGVFQWIALKAVQIGQGRPIPIIIITSIAAALASALLDNVTVVILISPIMMFVANTLGISPIPFLLILVMASNIGGAATLIGDPPNILIGSAANIDFLPFAANMTPPVLFSLLTFIPIAILLFRKQLDVDDDHRHAALLLDSRDVIKEPGLLLQTSLVLVLVLVGFFLHGALGLEPAVIALSGATLLLVITRRNPARFLESVEWNTLMFFVGLFIMVEALVSVGVIEELASYFLTATQGNMNVMTMFILWFSAIASGFIDNIPYTATMIPLIEAVGDAVSIKPLWWALALGADFGGNLTLVGASANVVAASLAERAGYRLTFGAFLKYGWVIVFVTLIISSIWLNVRYLM
ncbi:MAG: hypothetical protein EHM41_13320 [Chloroflexi bacterium]|nr:MAG: hypothetical protein EHM41_13320 [Chloroflexota bacterium]